MRSWANLGLAVVVAMTAACGADPAAKPHNHGGSSGTGGSNHGGTGGGGTTFDASDIQLNDVSILFPLPEDDEERDAGMLSVAAEGERGVLLPPFIYEAVGPVSGRSDRPETGAGHADYADLHVVALRFDPCFAELAPPADGKGCDNQLRLVVQEVREGTTFDSALHLFYSLERDELLDLVREISGLRQSLEPGEKLGKLQPHPIMVEQGLSGSMSQGVRDAVLAHAGSDNLIRVTRMTEVDGASWRFSGFDIENGEAVAMTIPTLTQPDPQQTFGAGFGTELQGQATPASSSEDDFVVLTDSAAALALSEADREAKLTALLRVESPSAHSPNTIDCVSCHIATPATKQVVEPVLGITSELAEELQPTFEVGRFTNVHAFSYQETSIGISQRTVNETAAVVKYLLEQHIRE